MMAYSYSRSSQRGSAIVYVFIGVILFAALALTFSRSMRGTTSDISSKTAKVGASEIVEYAKSVEGAVNKMLFKSISEADLGFTNSVTTLDASGGTIYSGNPNCASVTCQIFDQGGGKIKPRMPSPAYLIDNATLGGTDPMAGAIYPNVVIIDTLGSTEPDLVLSFFGLKMEVCAAINDLFGVENPSGTPPTEDGTVAGDQYKGSFSSSTTIGDGVTDLAGRTDFCYMVSGSDPALYVYDHVLMTR